MEFRFRLLVITLLAVAVGAVWTFPRWWPLVNVERVTEAFPGLAMEAQPDFIALPRSLRDAYFDLQEERGREVALAMVEARLLGEDVLSPTADQPFEPPANAGIVRQGEWRQIDAIRGAEGTVTIYEFPDLSRIIRLDDFRVTRAPGLHLIFTRNPDPMDEAGVGVDYIDVGNLLGNVGGQSYSVPPGVDFSRYPTVALYAEPLDLVISAATLR